MARLTAQGSGSLLAPMLSVGPSSPGSQGVSSMFQEGSAAWQPPVTLVFSDVVYDVPASGCCACLRRRRSSARLQQSNPLLPAVDPMAEDDTEMESTSHVRILQGVCGVLRPGEMMALMGSSGAGKSSLLDILARRHKSGTVGGRVLYCSDLARFPDDSATDIVGYVLQDDQMLPTESVRETLLFAARMRLPRATPMHELRKRVNDVIQDLELSHIADAPVGHPDDGGGISGGERKRLAIGVELVAGSRVLLLDEPTSGLDSHSADVVMSVLRRVASAGCVVICSIHQPASKVYRSFDKVLLLARGGFQLYFGPPNGVLRYFRDAGVLDNTSDPWVNPAEVLLEVSSGHSRQYFADLAASFVGSDVAAATLNHPLMADSSVSATPSLSPGTWRSPSSDLPLFRREQPSLAAKFVHLVKRGLRQMRRDPSLFFAQVGVTCVVALIVGLVFYGLTMNLEGLHDRTGFLYFAVVYFGLVSMSSLPVLFNEKLTFLRERAAGTYTTLPYFCSKLVCDMLPLRVLPPILFSAICYHMMGLNRADGRFGFFTLSLVVVNVTSTSMCFAVSALTQSVAQSNLLASLVFVFNILFGGLLLTARNRTIETIMDFAICNWGWQMLLVNEFDGREFVFDAKGTGNTGKKIDGAQWIANFGVDPTQRHHIKRDSMVLLVLIFCALLVLAYLVLSRLQKHVK